jgi:hypothetical protein
VRSEQRIILRITLQKILVFPAHKFAYINGKCLAFNGDEIYHVIEENNLCVTDKKNGLIAKDFFLIRHDLRSVERSHIYKYSARLKTQVQWHNQMNAT